VELPVRRAFEEPTIAGLTRRIAASGKGVESPPIVRVSREGAIPLSFAQERLWFLDQLEPGSSAYNLPSAVRLPGIVDGTSWSERYVQ